MERLFKKIISDKKYERMFYAIIIFICIIIVLIAIYMQFFYEYAKEDPLFIGINHTSDEEEILQLKNTFNDLFQNKLVKDSTQTDKYSKIQSEKEIVYTNKNLVDEDVNYYKIDVKIPKVNIDNENINKINDDINKEFYDIANDILRKRENKTIYSVNYIAFVNNNILSLVIKSTLKEDGKNEKTVIKTYNYNLETKDIVNLTELLENNDIQVKKVQTKIKKDVKKADENSRAIAEQYGTTYTRNLDDDMYKVENVKEFFITNEGYIYIVYAYGNNGEYTNETDIIII